MHVLVEVPRDDVDASGTPAMETYAVADYYRALFDGEFLDTTSPFRSSIPGVPFGGYQYQYVDDPRNTTVGIGSVDEVSPDAIWDQCGTQYRLTGVTVAYVDDAVIDSSADNNGALHSLGERLRDPTQRSSTDDFRVIWGQPYSRGPVVAIVKDVQAAHGAAHNHIAGISVNRNLDVNAIIDHELGHVMGIDSAPHPACASDVKGLMCDQNGVDNPIFGCASWRVGFERNAAAPCSADICTPEEIDLPEGCIPVAHPQNLCLTARNAASGHSAILTGNQAANVQLKDDQGNPMPASAETRCGDTAPIAVNVGVNHSADDTVPFEHPTRGGWSVTYQLAGVTLHYPPTQGDISVDLTLHPGGGIAVAYATYDLHSAVTRSVFTISRIPDTTPPEIAPLADSALPIRSTGQPWSHKASWR